MPLSDPYLTLLSPQQPASTPIRVARFLSGGTGDDPYEVMPLEFLHGRIAEGPRPSLFKVRYVFATNGGNPDWPTSAASVLDLGTTGPGIVEAGDRLVVQAAQGTDWQTLFDGYALDFAIHLDGGTEAVEITCEGVERTQFYQPVGGMFIRDASAPTDPSRTYPTDLPAVFNPKGKANCCDLAGAESVNAAGHTYPVFIDPAVTQADPANDAVPWTLDGAVLYLANHHNPDEALVKNPDDVTMLSVDTATATNVAIPCPDKPITGKYWPDVVSDLIGGKGFGMVWSLNGDSTTELVLFRQQSGDLKDVYLQPEGETLDLSFSNAAGISLQRSLTDVHNEIRVVGALERWEVSLILAPLFPMATADSSVANLPGWNSSDPSATGANGHYYRWFGVDEAGEGHYAVGSATKLTDTYDWSTVWGSDTPSVVRRRRALGDLLTTGPGGGPLKAKLEYAEDYGGDYPGEWSPGFTATWKEITSDWELLKDRVGILVKAPNPNAWTTGHEPGSSHANKLNLVEKLASGTRLLFRLTCVVESDRACTGLATVDPIDSITGSVISRTVDASDRRRRDTVGLCSRFNTSGADRTVRDDRDAATTEAQALQTAHQDGILEGPVRIPYFTMNYRVGDRIRSIDGRGLSLRTDAAAPGQDAVYPAVVAVEWTSSGDEQWTILHLSDAGLVRRGVTKHKTRRLAGA